MIGPKWKMQDNTVLMDRHRAKSQLARLDARLGVGIGADKERRQLARLIEGG